MPTSMPVSKEIPSARIWSRRRSSTHFSSLNSGIPYRSRPPSRSARSYTTTWWPARASCWAAASPAGPEPTTATRLPVFTAAGRGTTHPSVQAISATAFSMGATVTGWSLMESTQDASQRAGQTRPVTSGKLLVAWRRSEASCQRSRWTRSFHSGMRLPIGQPLWQKGVPQLMQRAACSAVACAGGGLVHLAPVVHPLRHRTACGALTSPAEKPPRISHRRSPRGRRPEAGRTPDAVGRRRKRGVRCTARPTVPGHPPLAHGPVVPVLARPVVLSAR